MTLLKFHAKVVQSQSRGPRRHFGFCRQLLVGTLVALQPSAVATLSRMSSASAAEILPRLFVGDKAAAEHLPYCGVRNVVNATERVPCHHEARGVNYLRVDVDDNEMAPIHKHFEASNRFINLALAANDGVLVHCHSGISRSVTLVVAYLIAERGFSLDAAIAHVCEARPQARPNPGFMRRLQAYEQQLKTEAAGAPARTQSSLATGAADCAPAVR